MRSEESIKKEFADFVQWLGKDMNKEGDRQTLLEEAQERAEQVEELLQDLFDASVNTTSFEKYETVLLGYWSHFIAHKRWFYSVACAFGENPNNEEHAKYKVIKNKADARIEYGKNLIKNILSNLRFVNK